MDFGSLSVGCRFELFRSAEYTFFVPYFNRIVFQINLFLFGIENCVLTLSGLGKGGFRPALCILIYILLTGDFQGPNVCSKFIIMYFKSILFLKHKFFVMGDPPPAPEKLGTPKKIQNVSGYRSAEWQLTLPYPYRNPTCFRIPYHF